MSDSELSSVLSSPPASDDESPVIGPLDKFLKKPSASKKKTAAAAARPPPSPPVQRKRPPSPPHEEVLADNPDIAFIVMFRSRFTEAFPPKCPHLGPQDIERGVVDPMPSPQVESLLCALLGLALNRKKPVEKGHYNRALEEAISTYKSQWPYSWGGISPIAGARTFNSMNPQERLSLMKAIIMWSLHGSELILNMLKESYKQSRHDDDLNQPLSVQPWGSDGDKRRYWLVEGRDDTPFRLYRESNPANKKVTWWSVAGSIEELRTVASNLAEDGTQASRRLGERILAAIPRFEATEEKRKRREYRMQRKAQFARPEPGFSLYEGRTRGKRMKYTFSDEEDEISDAISTRRSTRRGTPTDSRPVVTASGRQVRSRMGGLYGESLLSGQNTERDSPATADYERSGGSEEPNNRATRSGRSGRNGLPQRSHRKHIDGYNSIDEMDDEEEADEWDGGDDDDDDDLKLDDEEEESDGLSEDDFDDEIYVKPKGSLIVTLRIRSDRLALASSPPPMEEKMNYKKDEKMDVDSVGPAARSVEFRAENTNQATEQKIETVSEPAAKLPSPPASITTKTEQPELNGHQESTRPMTVESMLDTNGDTATQPAHAVSDTPFNAQGLKTQEFKPQNFQAQDSTMSNAPF